MSAPKLDTLFRFETPEGITLDLPVAGPPARALAFAIDLLIRGAIYLALSLTLGLLGELGTGPMLIGIFLAEWFYPVAFEIQRGATPGKKALGLVVVNDDGTPVAWSASVVRNLLRVADFFPALYAAGLVAMLVSPRFQRLGDVVAGTLVVYAPPARRRAPLAPHAALPPPVPLDRDEQAALVDFAERVPELAPARAVELAGILTPLHGREGQAALDEVLGYAAFVMRGNETT
ncbi:MAG: RDD family protein [Gammaproteobacteria bacterium]|nr:RDD family protein [Gammaproteobacteria bacterium]